MQTLITYGSQYGSTAQYARALSELSGLAISPYSEVKSTESFDRVIHFGALYAGGVMGLRHIVSCLTEKTKLIIITVGLADVNDENNISNIRRSIKSQIPREIYDSAQIFHLRGAIDYSRLSFGHRTMMALLYAKAKNLPEEKKNAETRAMIETYGQKVSFVDLNALRQLARSASLI